MDVFNILQRELCSGFIFRLVWENVHFCTFSFIIMRFFKILLIQGIILLFHAVPQMLPSH